MVKTKIVVLEVKVKDLCNKEIKTLLHKDLNYVDFRIKKIIIGESE